MINNMYLFAVYHTVYARSIYSWPTLPGTPNCNGILTDLMDLNIDDYAWLQVWEYVNTPLQNATGNNTLMSYFVDLATKVKAYG